MRSSFNSFFGSAALASYFTQAPVFAGLMPILNRLFAKEAELYTASLNDSKREETTQYTLNQSKYNRIHDLCDKIRIALDDYNRPRTDEDNPDTLNATLIQTLENLIDDTLIYGRSTLGLHRQAKERATARNVIRVAASGGAITAGVISTVATGSVAGVLVAVGGVALGAPQAASDAIIHYAGLVDEKSPTATIKILSELQTAIGKIKQLPAITASHIQQGQLQFNTDDTAYRCIITHLIMQDPVLCILDGRSYEREVILKALTIRPFSPVNNMPLKDKAPEDVLIPNRALQDLIQKYLVEHPDISVEEIYHSDVTQNTPGI